MARIVFDLPDRRVVQAFQAVANGHGSIEDWRLVSADLEAFTGFWEVTSPDTPNDQVKFAEGQRSVFGRIQALTRVTEPDLEKVEKARQPEDDYE